MSEVDPGQGAAAQEPRGVGGTLKAAREAQGLSLDEVGARTRIPLRHLEAIEQGDYASLPSVTYAVGFSRAYARAVGEDDVRIAAAVRQESGRAAPRPREYQPYEVADPARVPSRGLAIAALGVALALAILAGLYFASRWTTGGGTGSAEPGGSNAVVAAVPAAPAPSPTPATGGQVTLTASDEVWLRVYDADDKTLFIGTMTPGQRFDVPQGARDPKINVGRPDKLQVTLNGSAVPPLGTGERPIKDVRVGGEAIAQRLRSATDPAPIASMTAPTPATGGDITAAATGAAALTAATVARPRPARPARARAAASRPLTETQRANLQSAAQLRAQARRRP